eukprot:4260270-Pleurochrysis_carterae.AAC.1
MGDCIAVCRFLPAAYLGAMAEQMTEAGRQKAQCGSWRMRVVGGDRAKYWEEQRGGYAHVISWRTTWPLGVTLGTEKARREESGLSSSAMKQGNPYLELAASIVHASTMT